jgi:hypothetical protein
MRGSCGGHLRLIASIEELAVVRKILAHLGLAPPNPGSGPPLGASATAPPPR